MTDETTYDDGGENNDKAVLLSEEVDFLEELADAVMDLADEYADDPRIKAAADRIRDRMDVVREAMATAPPADPDAQADEGVPPAP